MWELTRMLAQFLSDNSTYQTGSSQFAAGHFCFLQLINAQRIQTYSTITTIHELPWSSHEQFQQIPIKRLIPLTSLHNWLTTFKLIPSFLGSYYSYPHQWSTPGGQDALWPAGAANESSKQWPGSDSTAIFNDDTPPGFNEVLRGTWGPISWDIPHLNMYIIVCV